MTLNQKLILLILTMIVGVSTLGYSLVKPSIANYYKKQEIVYYSPLINNDVLPNNRNKLIDLNLTYNSMMKMQNNITHWLNYCQKNKKNCNP